MKVVLIRGVTIADPKVYDREKGGDPPTFAPGAVIDIDPRLAQELVGSGKARYQREPKPDEAVVTTATVAATETTAEPRTFGRKAGK
jgi:hypothetical protein